MRCVRAGFKPDFRLTAVNRPPSNGYPAGIFFYGIPGGTVSLPVAVARVLTRTVNLNNTKAVRALSFYLSYR